MKKIFLILLMSSFSVNAGLFLDDIHSAAKDGDLELLKKEVEVGVDVNKTSSSGITPLMYATYYGNSYGNIVKYLISKGADIDYKSPKTGRTALSSAVYGYNYSAARLLVDNGADVNTRDFLGNTPLMIAVVKFPAITDDLIEWGADTLVKNNAGQTALDRLKNTNSIQITSESYRRKYIKKLKREIKYQKKINKQRGLANNEYKALDKNSIIELKKFINKYGEGKKYTKDAKLLVSKLLKKRKSDFKLAKAKYQKISKTNFSGLKIFVEKANNNLPQFKQAGDDIAKLIFKRKKIEDYRWFAKKYPNHISTKEVLVKISEIENEASMQASKLVKQKNVESCKVVTDKIFNSNTKTIINTFYGQDYVKAIAFSSDCSLIAWGGHSSLKVYSFIEELLLLDIEGLEENGITQNHRGNSLGRSEDIRSIAFSSDNKTLALGLFSANYGEDTLLTLDLKTGKLLNTFEKSLTTNSIVFNLSGNILYSSAFARDPARSIKLINAQTGKTIRKFDAQKYRGYGDMILVGKRLLFTKIKQGVALFDVDTGKLLKSFSDKDKKFTVKAFSLNKNNTITLIGGNNIIKIWDINTGKIVKSFKNKSDNDSYVSIATISPNGNTIAMYKDNIVELINSNGNIIKTFKGLSGNIASIAFSPDGNIIAVGGGYKNKTFTLLNVEFHNQERAEYVYNKLNMTKLSALHNFSNRFYYDFDVVKKAKNIIAKIIQKRNTAKDYAWFVKHYHKHDKIDVFVGLAYKLIQKEKKIKRYEWFIDAFPNYSSKNAIRGIFAIVGQKNILDDYIWFEKKYHQDKHAKQAAKGILDLVAAKNTVVDYDWFEKKYHYDYAQYAEQATNSAYKIIHKENIINRYRWFVERFSNYSVEQEAVRDMHILAYQQAKKKNTLEAYNYFSINYPSANQIQLASDKAYELEKGKYKGWFSSDEKNSTALYIKIRQMEKRMERSSNSKYDSRYGYKLVMERMGQLLQDLFPSEVATMNYMETSRTKAVKIER